MTTSVNGPRRTGFDDRASSEPANASARSALLTGGVIAGPTFVIAALAQAWTRDGFLVSDHPVSLLSVGHNGWVQSVNFIVAGLLVLGASVGLRRSMVDGPGATWGPRLIGVFAASLVVGGIFDADPALGFPPGTPPGAPDDVSWHGMIHGAAPAIGFTSLIVACFVFARRFQALGKSRWAVYSLLTGLASLPLSAWPNLGEPDGRFLPLWIAIVLGFAWTSAVCASARGRIAED